MPTEKGRVYVIDDDEALRNSLAFLLRTARIDVESYASAGAFLEALPTTHASCVITDVRMPGMSGLDLLRRLRELKIEVPVMMITGPWRRTACGRSDEDWRERFPGKAFRRRTAAGECSGAGAARRRDEAQRRARPDRKQAGRSLPTASVMSWAGWWRAVPTSRSPSISASVRVPWKFIAPTL